MQKIFINQKPHLALFAIKKIEVGQELRYDYGVKDLHWRKKKGNWV